MAWLESLKGYGGTGIALVLLVFFAPIFIGPLRLLLSSLTQSAALIIAHVIGLLTSIGVSALQLATLISRGIIPRNFSLQGWFANSLLLLIGAVIGLLASQYYSVAEDSTQQNKEAVISVSDPNALAKADYETF